MEKQEFIKIIGDHKRILYKIIYSYCQDAEDRKDLEQEIIIQLWKSIANYDSEYRLSTWIYKVALNVAVSHYRKDLKHKTNNIPLDEAIFKVAQDDLDEELLDSRTQQLYKFIDQFNPFNKAIIILYLEGKGYKEIGEILGLSETNVGTKVSRIKQQLKQNFSQLSE